MQRGLLGTRLIRRTKALNMHACTDARQQPCTHANNWLHPSYSLHVRNTPKAKTPSWRAFVLEARTLARMSQQALADAMGVNKSTVWRWENEDRGPESVEMALRVADATRSSRELAVAAAGFALPEEDDELDPRLRGLDPADPVVRHIMGLDIDEETRGYMLDRRREILALRREQDLRELDIIVRRERGAA
jgi:transcriptional regulator with XRE-family HTH domain